MRGTFANVRLKPAPGPGDRSRSTCPTAEMSIGPVQYQKERAPLLGIAGKARLRAIARLGCEGPRLPASAVIAQSYERIHR